MILKLDMFDRKSAARYGLRCWWLRCWFEALPLTRLWATPLEEFFAGRWSTWTISVLLGVC